MLNLHEKYWVNSKFFNIKDKLDDTLFDPLQDILYTTIEMYLIEELS